MKKVLAGFEYSTVLSDKISTLTTICDYQIIDYEQIAEHGRAYYYGKDFELVDEDFNMIYERLVDYYSVLGFECYEV